MSDILYDLFIRPIWLLLEIVFKAAYSICDNPGISIIFVSLAVNILILPLYLKSDEVCALDRAKQKVMEPWIRHIRKTFSGDERFMMLSEYYRQNDWQPYYVLRSSLSLLLQVPFFIAAYKFLSELQLLHGVAFGPIADLGAPDAIASIGGMIINLLPILMTAINLISSVIYTKGGPLREKIQTIVLALVFLVLLYNSPAGLVFYWTLNNLFSLGKNIVLGISGRLLGTKKKEIEKISPQQTEESDRSKRIWFVSSLFMTVIVGMIIPLSVMSASPLEFIERGKYADPSSYVITTTSTAAGVFLVWSGVVFLLGTRTFRKIYSRVCIAASVVFFMNYMFFSQNFGVLFDDLRFSETFGYTWYEDMQNLLTAVVVAAVITVFVKNHPRSAVSAVSILVVSSMVIGIYQTIQVSAKVRSSENYKYAITVADGFAPVLKLSRTGKNVAVIMIDAAVGSYFPYVLNEKPELAEAFDGFTYYPNTVSFSGCTSQSIPSLFGGYEYTTWEMNERDDEPIRNKINEALTLLPTLFSEKGYATTICDIPYGNFDEDGDLSIFDNIKDCDTYWLGTGIYRPLLTEDEQKAGNPERMERNFFCYSLMRVMPLAVQTKMYDGGDYNGLYQNSVTNGFINSYAVMEHLGELTGVTDDKAGDLLMMVNNMTHEPTFLDPPDYLLTSVTRYNSTEGRDMTVDGRTMLLDTDDRLKRYDSNISAYCLFAKWFRTLKDEGVYDNTRIIIVSDHGRAFGQFEDMLMPDIDLDAQAINPIMLVKDFGSQGLVCTDEQFMTLADVPVIATKGIADGAVNPFAGNAVSSGKKEEGPVIVNASTMGMTVNHEQNTYNIDDSHWYTVEKNIYDKDNWKLYE